MGIGIRGEFCECPFAVIEQAEEGSKYQGHNEDIKDAGAAHNYPEAVNAHEYPGKRRQRKAAEQFKRYTAYEEDAYSAGCRGGYPPRGNIPCAAKKFEPQGYEPFPQGRVDHVLRLGQPVIGLPCCEQSINSCPVYGFRPVPRFSRHKHGPGVLNVICFVKNQAFRAAEPYKPQKAAKNSDCKRDYPAHRLPPAASMRVSLQLAPSGQQFLVITGDQCYAGTAGAAAVQHAHAGFCAYTGVLLLGACTGCGPCAVGPVNSIAAALVWFHSFKILYLVCDVFSTLLYLPCPTRGTLSDSQYGVSRLIFIHGFCKIIFSVNDIHSQYIIIEDELCRNLCGKADRYR